MYGRRRSRSSGTASLLLKAPETHVSAGSALRLQGGAKTAHTIGTIMNTGFLKLTAILGVLAIASACTSTRTQESAGEAFDDSVLTSKVKVALIDDPVTKASQINVETYRGVVQLGGFVDNTQQKEQATRVARSVTGVKEVRNDLLVSTKPSATSGQDVDDSMLTASVKAKLTEDSTTKAYQINVGTEKGV